MIRIPVTAFLSKVTIFLLSLPKSFDLKHILFLSSFKVCEIYILTFGTPEQPGTQKKLS